MERIDRVDPAEDAALKRLLFAIALSLLMHAVVVAAGGNWLDTGSTALHDQLPSPPVAALSVSLQNGTTPPGFRSWIPVSVSPLPGVFVGAEVLDARYYSIEDLDVLPVPREPIRMPNATPASGVLRLLTRIDASGRVTGVSVFDSGANEAEITAAINAMRGSAFFAARKHGRPVRSEVVIELVAVAGT